MDLNSLLTEMGLVDAFSSTFDQVVEVNNDPGCSVSCSCCCGNSCLEGCSGSNKA